jgi:acetate kinase
MLILVLNSGSSSIKYRLFDMRARRARAWGQVERIGEPQGRFVLAFEADERRADVDAPGAFPDHAAGFARLVAALGESGLVEAGSLAAVGHRVVHGGEAFAAPVVVDGPALDAIRANVALAPLHNPANLTGIEVARACFPGVPQVAVFDTAFHQTIPEHAYRYAVPERLYRDLGVRRYGFHGTSHRYVRARVAEHLGRPIGELNAIILHLGNGASATAIRGGESVDTSMGLTPLEGLIMGTRSGDVDPALHAYLARTAAMSLDEIDAVLNRDSGLKGLCGSNDVREIHRAADGGDEAARLALEMYCYRIRKYIGAYTAVLGRVDALAFTAGVGENDARVRARCCAGLEHLGIELDERRNAGPEGDPASVGASSSRVRVLVVGTNEELQIAHEVARCLAGNAA